MNVLDVDEVIRYVNKIIENVRCATCDKLEGCRVRYPCGHIACEDCVAYTDNCLTCTPPGPNAETVPDFPLTENVQHSATLLKACHKLFDFDAFQRKRLSEQLKIERNLFPKCIQARVKYENKRKSTRFSMNKENQHSTFFPGEAIFPKHNTMENSVSYVQQWLNKNDKSIGRKPFADLDINTQKINTRKNKNGTKNIEKNNVDLGVNRKRSHYKTIDKSARFSQVNKMKRSVNEFGETPKKVKTESSKIKTIQKKWDNDESGIFMDNEMIVIDDSQDTAVDKDKQAWLAVLEAHKNEGVESTSLLSSNQLNITIDSSKITNTSAHEIKTNNFRKVPFIKKSAIIESCIDCKNEMNSINSVAITAHVNSVPKIEHVEPVNISIHSASFITTITVVKDVEKLEKCTKSALIQTDLLETFPIENNVHTESVEAKCNESDKRDNLPLNICDKESLNDKLDKAVKECDSLSEDLFEDDRINFTEGVKKAESNCIVIEESDSDTDLEVSGPRSVRAEVHRSCEEIDYGILTNIVNVKEHQTKARRGPRGNTPTSTDSSEKENYNPNRMRRRGAGKKKLRKK